MEAVFAVMYPLIILLSLSSLSMAEEDRCIYSLNNVPYITFMGQKLSNHSFIDVAMLGDTAATALQCHTDLNTCCSDSEGVHSGVWVTPSEVTELSAVGLDVIRQSQRVDLVYVGIAGNGGVTLPPTGIYRCDVPTNAVNDEENAARESVYVGVYAAQSKQKQKGTFCSVILQLILLLSSVLEGNLLH